MNGFKQDHRILRRLTALLLCLCLLLTGVSAADLASGTDSAAAEDTTAFGSAANLTTEAWTNNALSADACRELINSETLYPQRTGWIQLDQVIETMLQPYEGQDTYTKLWAMYDWLVKNVTYSWSGYSKQTAPAYEYFATDYLSGLTYEEGLEKSIPDDMANRTYHILTEKKGVCYDYAIAFAVIARYVGIESYVHTGYFIFEDTSLGSGHHGWSLLVLGGEKYVFDPQRDARNWQYNRQNGYYFGISQENATRYRPNTASADVRANAERDASLLPVTADRAHMVTVTATADGEGTVSGGGSYITRNTATLRAVPADGWKFVGWYNASGTCLSTSATYTFTVTDQLDATALFGAEITLKSSCSGQASGAGICRQGETALLTATSETAEFDGWYDLNGKLVSTENPLRYTVTGPQTLVAMFEGDVFYDMSATAWYREAALRANEAGIINGTNKITFSANSTLNRAMAVTMIARLNGADTGAYTETPFTDVAAGRYYFGATAWGAETGVVNGTAPGIFSPLDNVTREQFMTMLERYLEYLGYEFDVTDVELPFTDSAAVSNYAKRPLTVMYTLGLVKGYNGGETVAPKQFMTRAEGVTLVVRVMDYIAENPLTEEPEEPEEPEELYSYIVNGDFAEGSEGWKHSGGTVIEVGQASLASGSDTDRLTQKVSLEKGKTYTLVIDVESCGAELTFGVNDYNGRYTKLEQSVTEAGSYALTFTTASHIDTVEVFLQVLRYQSSKVPVVIRSVALYDGE